MPLPIEYNLANNGAGATGFTSLNRGLSVSRDEVPIIRTLSEGGDQVLLPSRGVGERDGGRSVVTSPPGETAPDRMGGLLPQGGVLPERSISDRRTTARRDDGRSLARSITSRAKTEPRDLMGRGIDSPPIISGAGSQAGVNQPKSPLDFNVDQLFRGYFNEPIRGSADKSGEFLYIPPAKGGSSNSGLAFFLIAGAGIAGYFIYRKFKGGD